MGTLWTEVQLLKSDLALAPNVHAARSVISRLVADAGTASRRDIVRYTGLARSTIEGHLKVLLDAGILEDAVVGGSTLRGRPAQMFRVSPEPVVLVADVQLDHSDLALAGLDKTFLNRRRIDLPVDEGPEQLLSAIAEGFDALLASAKKERSQALAISVGLPGPVDAKLGYAVRPPHMPGWDGFGVCRAMASRFLCDVVTDSDTNLMALGEARSLQTEDLPLLLVHIGSRVSGGFVSESGLLLHGAEGAAGDVGHIRVPGSGDSLCNCGRRGCLEAIASAEAISRRVSEVVGRPMSTVDVIESLKRGEAATVDAVRGVASHVGSVIAGVVNFCNPARIVLNGTITACTEDFLAQVRSIVYQQAQPLATRNLAIHHGALGEEASLIGGMVSAIEQALSPRGMQYVTRGEGSTLLPLGL